MYYEVQIYSENENGIKCETEVVQARTERQAIRKIRWSGYQGKYIVFPLRTYSLTVKDDNHEVIFESTTNDFHADHAFRKMYDKIPDNARVAYLYCDGIKCPFNTRTEKFEDVKQLVIKRKFLFFTTEVKIA